MRSAQHTCSAWAGRKNMVDAGLPRSSSSSSLKRHSGSTPPIPLVTLNTDGPTLAQRGTDEQKHKFLPAILAGTVEFAIGRK